MVRRWKDEILLGVILLGCSAFGGYFGAKMAQIECPKGPATYDHWDTFGSLPPAPDTVPMGSDAKPPVIIIVVNKSQDFTSETQRAIDKQTPVLNPIQKPVNFI